MLSLVLHAGILRILVNRKNALDVSGYVVSVNWKMSIFILRQSLKKRED